MKTVAIVAGAGSGKRLGLKTKKPFVSLRGKPLIAYSLGVLDSSPSIDGIIVAVDRSCLRRFSRLRGKCRFRKIKDVVMGGRTRAESVRNCLRKVGGSYDVVLVHDAARPFLDHDVIRRSIAAAMKFGSSVVSIPESDTVKRVGEGLFVEETLERSRIWRAQTPQSFRRSLIVDAYAKAKARRGEITDDSSLVERMGKRVKVVVGSPRNLKITTKEDLLLAEALLSEKRSARGGSAWASPKAEKCKGQNSKP